LNAYEKKIIKSMNGEQTEQRKPHKTAKSPITRIQKVSKSKAYKKRMRIAL
jgi:hypothetical protein